MSNISLGFNCNCFTNRYDEPEEWTRLCSSLGVRNVMFSVDLIDPYWSWETQKKLCDRTLDACAKHNIEIRASFGGQHGHQHYLGHPDEDVRKEAEEFYRRAIRQTAYLNAKSFGTCFAIQTVRTDSDQTLRNQILNAAIESYYHLASFGKEQGLQSISYEMTSIRREMCATFEENDMILERCGQMAIPMKICLDMGHRNHNGSPEEADHLAWIRKFASKCEVIDCQQTNLESSCHWPFTEENNSKGVIRGEEIVKTIDESGAGDIMLAFELRCPAFYPQENSYLSNLEKSVSYWRQFVEN